MNLCSGFLVGWALIALFAGCASIEFSFPDFSAPPPPLDNYSADEYSAAASDDNVLLSSETSGGTLILQSEPFGRLLNFTIEIDGALCNSQRITLTVNGQEVYTSAFAAQQGPAFYTTTFSAHPTDEIRVFVTSARERICFSSGRIWWRITD